jgi:hypothetical protein
MSPSGRVAQLYPQAPGSFVAFYDSRGTVEICFHNSAIILIIFVHLDSSIALVSRDVSRVERRFAVSLNGIMVISNIDDEGRRKPSLSL